MNGRKYHYTSETPPHTMNYLLPSIDGFLRKQSYGMPGRVLDFGCGNGWLTKWFTVNGYSAVGVDISETGIEIAARNFQDATFSNDLSATNLQSLGPFDLAVCVETIAHCHHPAQELVKIYDSMKPGGQLILTTPYHGYCKNLLLAAVGRMDAHLTALWSGGYVRFFSRETITHLLESVGFMEIQIKRVGRLAPFAKSMVVSAVKPLDSKL